MAPDESQPSLSDAMQPHTADEHIRRGWTLHVQGDPKQSEEAFRRAISMEPKSIEAQYGLGMTLKVQSRKQEAIEAFEKTITLLAEDQSRIDPARATMLRHLSQSQILLIKTGAGAESNP